MVDPRFVWGTEKQVLEARLNGSMAKEFALASSVKSGRKKSGRKKSGRKKSGGNNKRGGKNKRKRNSSDEDSDDSSEVSTEPVARRNPSCRKSAHRAALSLKSCLSDGDDGSDSSEPEDRRNPTRGAVKYFGRAEDMFDSDEEMEDWESKKPRAKRG